MDSSGLKLKSYKHKMDPKLNLKMNPKMDPKMDPKNGL